jgi:hypothetical protein
MSPSQIFSGWKEIATYLRKGVRTVQRYERELRLPVRRPAGKAAGSVIAIKAELDGWVAAAPFRQVLPLLRDSLGETAINTRTTVDELRRRVGDLHRLRQETEKLQATLLKSMESLQETLRLSVIVVSPESRVPANVLRFSSRRVQ